MCWPKIALLEIDLRADSVLFRLQIVTSVQVHLELERCAGVVRGAKRCSGGNAASAMHDVVDAATRQRDIDRVPVHNLAADEAPGCILYIDQYPSLKLEHVPAAIGYAADLVVSHR